MFQCYPECSRMLVSRHIRQDLRRLTTPFGNVEIFPAWAGPRANALEHRRSRAFGRHIMRTISRSGPAPKARSKPRILKITGLGITQELITIACSRRWTRDSGTTKRTGVSLEQTQRDAMDGWGRAACKREPPAEILAKAILRRPQQMTGLIGIARSLRLKPQSQTMEMTPQ